MYWSNTNGQRDIYTIASTGGPRTPLTNDLSPQDDLQGSSALRMHLARVLMERCIGVLKGGAA